MQRVINREGQKKKKGERLYIPTNFWKKASICRGMELSRKQKLQPDNPKEEPEES